MSTLEKQGEDARPLSRAVKRRCQDVTVSSLVLMKSIVFYKALWLHIPLGGSNEIAEIACLY